MVARWSLCVGFSLKLCNECSFACGNLSFALLMGEFGGVPAFLGGRFGVFGLFVCWISTDCGMGFLVDFFQLKNNFQKKKEISKMKMIFEKLYQSAGITRGN